MTIVIALTIMIEIDVENSGARSIVNPAGGIPNSGGYDAMIHSEFNVMTFLNHLLLLRSPSPMWSPPESLMENVYNQLKDSLLIGHEKIMYQD